MPLFCPHAADVCDRPAEVTLKVQPVKPLSFLRLVPLLDLVVWLNGWLNTGREKTPTNTGSHTIWQEASAATDKHTYNNDVVRITHTHTHTHTLSTFPSSPLKSSVLYSSSLWQQSVIYCCFVLFWGKQSCTLMSQNIMTTCMMCCWSVVCHQNTSDFRGPLRYQTPGLEQHIL